MTTYDPDLHRDIVGANGEANRKFWPINKWVILAGEAGIIDLVKQDTEPADTSVVWLDVDTPESANGTVKVYSGGSWIAMTPALFATHIGAGGGGGGGPTAASDVSVDNTGYEVITASDAQTAFDQTDAALLKARSTGILYGGALTDQGSGVVRIAAGEGGILDNSDPQNPTYTAVTWAQTDLDLSATNGLHYVYVNAAGTVTSTTTAPSHSDYRTAIWLWRVSILSNVYSASTAIPMPGQQYGPGVWDVFRALGSVKYGLDLSANGANLSINIAAGEAYQPGANFFTDPTSPHERDFSAKTAATFRLVKQDGVQGSDTTTLDVGNYDLSGTITAIPGASTRAQIWTVKMFLGGTGNVRIFYGQNYYTSVTEALTALREGTYSPTIPSSFNDAITLGWIITQKGATALNDGTQTFVTANKFGLTGGSVASAGAGALLTVNNLSELTATASTARSNISAEQLGVQRGVNTQTGNYTAVLSDAGQTVEMNVGSANTFTVPPNASVAFETGTYLNVSQYGAGQTTITPGAGVTIRARNGLKTGGQYAMATLYKRGTNEWVAGGDLTT